MLDLDNQNPGQPGVDPVQVTTEPKEVENKVDYKSFFDTQMNQRIEEKNSLTERLNDSKLSEQEKFRIEKNIFEIERELSKYGFNADVAKNNIVEDIVKEGLQPNTEAYNYIKDITSGLDYDDAKVVVDGLLGLVKAMGGKVTNPVSLDGKIGGEDRGQVTDIQLNAAGMIGENGSANKKALVGLLSELSKKGF